MEKTIKTYTKGQKDQMEAPARQYKRFGKPFSRRDIIRYHANSEQADKHEQAGLTAPKPLLQHSQDPILGTPRQFGRNWRSRWFRNRLRRIFFAS